MPNHQAPDNIVQLAQERAEARSMREWQRADELRASIEAAGWRVVDAGMDFELSPARPADLVEDGRTLYGALDSVPSRLDQPATAAASVIVVASIAEAPLPEVLAAIRLHCPGSTQVVIVAAAGVATDPSANDVEIVWTAAPFSAGAALQAGLRRATGSTIVVLEPDRVPDGDIVSPLIEALAEPSVAIVGRAGLRSRDLRRYQLTPVGDATALRPGCYAFSREDAIARGPIDERLHLAGSVAAWWSLVLRDEGQDVRPRRAVAMQLPFADEPRDWALPADHARQARRDSYRIAARFGGRSDLAASDET